MKFLLITMLALAPVWASAGGTHKVLDNCSEECKRAYQTEVSGKKPHAKVEVCVEAPYRRSDKLRLRLLRADGTLTRDTIYWNVVPVKHPELVTYSNAPRVQICVGAQYARQAYLLWLCQGWDDGATSIANRAEIEAALKEAKPGKPGIIHRCLLEELCPDYRGKLPN